MNPFFSKVCLVAPLFFLFVPVAHSLEETILNHESIGLDDIILLGDRDLEGGVFGDWWDQIPSQSKEKFAKRNTLKKNAKLKAQKVRKNRVTITNEDLSLEDEDLDAIEDIFAAGATYTINGQARELPSAGVFRSKADKSVVITKGANGKFLFASKTLSNGKTEDVLPIQEGSDVFVTVDSDDVDEDELNSKFHYGEAGAVPGGDGGGRGLRVPTSRQDFVENDQEDEDHRSLQACPSYDVIEVAIAFESFFCADFNNDSVAATNAVVTTVSEASALYQQPGLCMKVVISHLEGFCNNVNDPYEDMMKSRSVCGGNRSLLERFRAFWKTDRENIPRDTAHLFHGKEFSTSTIGCAYLDALCSTNGGYGVNFITYTTTTSRWPILFAHELGHNAGTDHDCDNCSFIMRPSICGSCTTFSSSSINQILSHIGEVGCIDPEGPTTPTPPTPTPPTSAPPPTPPSPCADDDEWYFTNKKGKRKNCDWVSKRKDKRCQKSGRDGDDNPMDADQGCPSTCGSSCR